MPDDPELLLELDELELLELELLEEELDEELLELEEELELLDVDVPPHAPRFVQDASLPGTVFVYLFA